MTLTFENMQEYLENAGYNIDGMHAEEVDALAEAENFTFDESKNAYRYNA